MLSAIPMSLILPPTHLLVWGGYPILRLESLLLLGSFLLTGLVLTLVLSKHPASLRLATLVLTVVAALMIGPPDVLSDVFPFEQAISAALTAILFSMIIVGVPALLIIGLKDNGLAILGGTFTAMLISTILVPLPAAPAIAIQGDLPIGDQNLPPVMHLVMDEHAGISQLPATVVEEISALLDDFRVFPDAYSPFSFTPFAMAAMLNPHLEAKEISPDSHRNRWLIEPNRWFDHLATQGYVISVHQPDLLEYCASEGLVDRCYTYNPTSVGYLADFDFPPLTKLRLLASKMVPWLADIDPFPIFLWPTAAIRAMEDAALLLQTGARGRVFFLHLTIPHGPFLYDSQCRLRFTSGIMDSGSFSENSLTPYYEQMRCAWRQIERLLVVLKENSDAADAVILLHGDHGLRYASDGVPDPAMDPSGARAASELRTLLAIRGPTLTPGTLSGRIVIPRAVDALMGNCNDQADDGVGYTVPRSDFRNKLTTQAPIQLQLPPIGPALVPVCSPTR